MQDFAAACKVWRREKCLFCPPPAAASSSPTSTKVKVLVNMALQNVIFRQAKHCQKGPAATFRPKGVCSSMYTGLFTFYSLPQYLSSFSSWTPKSKKFPFFTNFHCHLQKNCWPAAESILMPPTFHIASLNRYTPTFSGVPQKLTRCHWFDLQHPPKFAYLKRCP